MTKPELLQLMRLLSALESALTYDQTNRTRIPDYLLEHLANCAEVLEREILK